MTCGDTWLKKTIINEAITYQWIGPRPLLKAFITKTTASSGQVFVHKNLAIFAQPFYKAALLVGD